MESGKELANRFREVALNGEWIANTNFQEQIRSVTWKQATTKIESLNTLALLVFHVNYNVSGVTSLSRRRRTGD